MSPETSGNAGGPWTPLKDDLSSNLHFKRTVALVGSAVREKGIGPRAYAYSRRVNVRETVREWLLRARIAFARVSRDDGLETFLETKRFHGRKEDVVGCECCDNGGETSEYRDEATR